MIAPPLYILMIAPPLYIQPTREAISELADRMGGYARDLADTLRGGDWTRAAADHALDRPGTWAPK
jgi:hypothetical protein